MKNLIIFISIILIIAIACIIGLSLNFNVNHLHNDDKLVFGEPFTHKEHTHEHSGLACCPCGVCHFHMTKKKYEEQERQGQEEDEEHVSEPIEYGLLIKIISTILVFMVLITALHL